MNNPLLDAQFLKELDLYPHKNKYVKIISLDKNDYPREQIEGIVTGGSINVDGASALRRTCSLSFGVPDPAAAITDAYWAFDNKFKLEIGLKNDINPEYPDIIWFKQGTYIVTSFSKSTTTNNISISISGKDKMCRLNGEVGGNITSQWDFGQLEEVDSNGNITLIKLPIYQIIQQAVVQYGQERAENVIINDLAENGWELWEYRGDEPMYLFLSEDGNNTVFNMTFNGDTEIDIYPDNQTFTLKQLGTEEKPFQFYSLNTLDADYNSTAGKIYWGDYNNNNKKCFVAKIEYGDTAGYHQTPLVYNADLILNAGETITSLLDKLKNMLGEFEYFYDLDGHFVFQKKQNYIQELFSPIDGEIINPIMTVSPYSYKFEDERLFTSISETPQVPNVKNDFTVWGSRKGIAGTDIPIHVRYAIDKKPQNYITPWDLYEKIKEHYFVYGLIVNKPTGEFKDILYSKSEDGQYKYIGTYEMYNDLENKPSSVYQIKTYTSYKEMKQNLEDLEPENYIYEKIGKDYIAVSWDIIKSYYQKIDDNTYEEITDDTISNTNTKDFNLNLIYRKREAKTNYSISEYDWRELIYQMAVDYYKHNTDSDFLVKIENENPNFIGGKTGYEQYYVDLQGFWRQLYNPALTNWDIEQYGEFYDINGSDGNGNDKYWNKKIHTDPVTLNFWFDFLDVGEGTGLSKYAVNKIGSRTKVDNNNSVKSIYFKETPEVQFVVIPTDQYDRDKSVYSPIWIQDNMRALFTRSSQGLAAISRVNELISQHTAMTEGISLNCIPIYYLEPNTRIYVKGKGDYVLTKISYQLNYNGTMSLSGTKITESFY